MTSCEHCGGKLYICRHHKVDHYHETGKLCQTEWQKYKKAADEAGVGVWRALFRVCEIGRHKACAGVKVALYKAWICTCKCHKGTAPIFDVV